MITAVLDAVTKGGTCDDTDNFGLAEYQWSSEVDHTSPVTVTSLVKSFESGGESYICGTGPLVETPVEAGDETEAMLEKEAETDVSVNMKNLQLTIIQERSSCIAMIGIKLKHLYLILLSFLHCIEGHHMFP